MTTFFSFKHFLLRKFFQFQKFVLSIFAFSPRPNFDAKPKNILLFRISALGDFIFAVPALHFLRKQFPEARITLVTSTSPIYRTKAGNIYDKSEAYYPWLSFVFPAIVDKIICIDNFGKEERFKIKKMMNGDVYDLAITLAHNGESYISKAKKILFLRFLGVRCQIKGWGNITSNRYAQAVQYNAKMYKHQVYAPIQSVSESLNINEPLIFEFLLDIKDTSKDWVETLFKKYYIETPVVAVSPGSVQPHKQWPVEKYLELCKLLTDNFDFKIILVGVEKDYHIGEIISQALNDKALNLIGKTSLQQSAAIFEKCVLLVGNDGGSIHLGDAVGIPVVSIISGIEYPNIIDPFNNAENSVRHKIECSPCYNFLFCPLGHNNCLKQIEVQDVYKKCSSIIKRI